MSCIMKPKNKELMPKQEQTKTIYKFKKKINYEIYIFSFNNIMQLNKIVFLYWTCKFTRNKKRRVIH